ncbi:uncharacterized protein F4822DRAFT_315839 [Hypoxylon trugodes]|uniref:uncharacterized protein n=1 Tax=Hypoxylon trugodes TaxID=326681 RepID=UPI00218D7658|nr:uncharacterized protein F4822DRAFT_315839 [Hypoxylon trugodes]KAI1386414.1 hypothetical protein F4822DRAFT_315839 [Hypoxylon trugodes]
MSSGKAWSEKEKFDFLLQIVDRLLGKNGSVPYKDINLPGRTIKSMTHTMGKLRAQAAAFRQGGGDVEDPDQDTVAAPATPKGRGKGAAAAATPPTTGSTPRRGTRKRPQKVAYFDSTSDDDEEVKTPVKKARTSSDKEEMPTPKRVKGEDKKAAVNATQNSYPSPQDVEDDPAHIKTEAGLQDDEA